MVRLVVLLVSIRFAYDSKVKKQQSAQTMNQQTRMAQDPYSVRMFARHTQLSYDSSIYRINTEWITIRRQNENAAGKYNHTLALAQAHTHTEADSIQPSLNHPVHFTPRKHSTDARARVDPVGKFCPFFNSLVALVVDLNAFLCFAIILFWMFFVPREHLAIEQTCLES